MKPDCKCFEGDMRGENNSTFAALGVEDVFCQAMTAYNMCPKSGYYVALTSMVLILRKVALVNYRTESGDRRTVGELNAMDVEKFDQIERVGFAAMMKTLVADMVVREEELQQASLMADKEGSTSQ